MKPEISILMPIYNSIERNGPNAIHRAINALLYQTFENFELLILDNKSTDATQEICYNYGKQDSRIKYMIDSTQRFPEGGINELARYVTTPYLMIANDDDKWEQRYIQVLFDALQIQNTMDCAYSNGHFMSDGNSGGVIIPDENIRDYYHEPYTNYRSFIQTRNVVPMLFGLFKSEAYLATLPYKPFDTLKANVDNLFAAKFFLKGFKALFVNRHLFHYSNKPRKLEAKTVEGMPENPVLIWFFYVQHQLSFYQALLEYIPKDDITSKLVTLNSCLQRLPPLLSWVRKALAEKESDKEIIESINSKLPNSIETIQHMSIAALTKDLHDQIFNILSISEYAEMLLGESKVLSTVKDTLWELYSNLEEAL